MATSKPQFLPLFEDRFYRKAEVITNRYFGVGASALDAKVRAGEIEPPIKLSPNGRATGWFGRYIIEWQNKIRQAV